MGKEVRSKEESRTFSLPDRGRSCASSRRWTPSAYPFRKYRRISRRTNSTTPPVGRPFRTARQKGPGNPPRDNPPDGWRAVGMGCPRRETPGGPGARL